MEDLDDQNVWDARIRGSVDPARVPNLLLREELHDHARFSTE